MPIIKVATAEARGVNRAFGWYGCGFDLGGAAGAVIVDKSRVQTMARLAGALAQFSNQARWEPGISSWTASGQAGGAQSSYGPLGIKTSSGESEGRLPDVGPFDGSAFDPALRNPDLVMFLFRNGWTATDVAQSLRQGPVIGGYGVAIVIDPEVVGYGGTLTTGKAGAVQALTGVLA